MSFGPAYMNRTRGLLSSFFTPAVGNSDHWGNAVLAKTEMLGADMNAPGADMVAASVDRAMQKAVKQKEHEGYSLKQAEELVMDAVDKRRHIFGLG